MADDWMVLNPSWGATADELAISIQPLVGKDGDHSLSPPIPPQVQKPPFPNSYLLQVQDPKGECLNLRESFEHTSGVIRCLPTGTKLAVADLSQAPIQLSQALHHNDDQVWLWARTEEGETGWVSLGPRRSSPAPWRVTTWVLWQANAEVNRMQERREQRKRTGSPQEQPGRASTPEECAPNREHKDKEPISESLVRNLGQNGF